MKMHNPYKLCSCVFLLYFLCLAIDHPLVQVKGNMFQDMFLSKNVAKTVAMSRGFAKRNKSRYKMYDAKFFRSKVEKFFSCVAS